MKITWYGHSCFLLATSKASLLIDPFLTGNAQAPCGPDEFVPDYILVTHGHGDHVGDTVAIARRAQATVISTSEVCKWLGTQGVSRCHAQHLGGGFDYPWGRLQLTLALHGSSMPDGSCGGNPCGLLLDVEGKTIYHAGDTGLFSDMRLIGEGGLDLALLPIGDNYTMGPAEALRAVKFLRPAAVIPMHYDTFPVIRQDPKAWAVLVEAKTDSRAVVLTPGETWTF